MLKNKDLTDRKVEDLKDLEKQLEGDLFQARFRNFTNRLDNTSLIKKSRRDLARVKTALVQKSKETSK
jgi:large subunit ribosomal protein L29